MGAGPRFQWNVRIGLGMGIWYDKFPYEHCIYIDVLFLHFFIGVGKPYDCV